MEDLEVVLTCPLGSTCIETKDNKIHRCRWYVKMEGEDATGNKHDKWDCAIAWMPILQTETSGQVHRTTAATEDLRNQVVERQDMTNKIMFGSMKAQLIPQQSPHEPINSKLLDMDDANERHV